MSFNLQGTSNKLYSKFEDTLRVKNICKYLNKLFYVLDKV